MVMPRVWKVDQNAANPPAVAALQADGPLTEECELRTVKYFNNDCGTGSPLQQAQRATRTGLLAWFGGLANHRPLRGDEPIKIWGTQQEGICAAGTSSSRAAADGRPGSRHFMAQCAQLQVERRRLRFLQRNLSCSIPRE
jgi:hypothetical protein